MTWNKSWSPFALSRGQGKRQHTPVNSPRNIAWITARGFARTGNIPIENTMTTGSDGTEILRVEPPITSLKLLQILCITRLGMKMDTKNETNTMRLSSREVDQHDARRITIGSSMVPIAEAYPTLFTKSNGIQ
jgi:hypothetical protein